MTSQVTKMITNGLREERSQPEIPKKYPQIQKIIYELAKSLRSTSEGDKIDPPSAHNEIEHIVDSLLTLSESRVREKTVFEIRQQLCFEGVLSMSVEKALGEILDGTFTLIKGEE